MIGKIILGASFGGCIAYCLGDKQVRKGAEVVHHGRAELLSTRYCFGGKEDFTNQFQEVRALNQKVQKPVMHITLSLAPGERLDRTQLISLVADLVQAMQVADRQLLAVEHRDTAHQHVHLVINRVGFDGRVLPDSHSYRKIAQFCRQAEERYGLQRVPNPRRFQSPAGRARPRKDQRKDHLRGEIEKALVGCRNYDDFALRLKAQGIKVLKGQGIAFLDDKGVKVKGSAVGHGWARIEGILKGQEAKRGLVGEMKEEVGSTLGQAVPVWDGGKRDTVSQGMGAKSEKRTGNTQEHSIRPLQESDAPTLLGKLRKNKRNKYSWRL
ncbi:MAG TPA: relaxase/mobilization nuclease domain-containing protein [Chitinophagaceae bacterium]|jgi:hypothetical protein|nr:relaxase/mobilization nuclease domain-containing protein [Chitinophagaceae bacterium]